MYSAKTISSVHKDVQHWVQTVIEQTHESYNPNMPVCPYAKQARSNQESVLKIYPGGGVKKFVINTLDWFLNQNQYVVMMQIFPPWVKYYPNFDNFVKSTNKKSVPLDYFSMPGLALDSKSAYPGWFNRGEYVVIGTNKLSKVLPAVELLKKHGYYSAPTWTDQHYNAIVNTRQRWYEKFGVKNNELD
jgi:hypothetical protein